MKIAKVILSIFIPTVLIFSPVVAQLEYPNSEGGITYPVSQCNDGFDNDGDKLIDTKGGTINGAKVGADPQCKPGVKCENGLETCSSSSGTPTSGSGFALKVKINNPLKVDTIQGAIRLFMDAVLRIAIPFIVIFFIWSGLSFVLARGNPTKLETAKKMFWYTVVGTLLILGAWTITNAIIGTVNSITG